MPELVHTLRLRDLFGLVIGAIIGSGVFLVPAGILNRVDHSVAAASLVWIAGGILSLLGALTYGELAAMKPAAGGLYVYIRDGFGPLPAFLYGWSLFLAIASGSISALAVAFSAYLGAVIPMSALTAKIVAVATIALLTAVNVWGTRQSSDLQNWTTVIKTVLLIAISAALLTLGRGFVAIPGSLWPSHLSASLFSNFGLAMVTVLWAYEGWQFATYNAAETTNPERDFPIALSWGVMVIIVLYLLANFGYLAALGPERAGHSETIAAASVSAVLGPWAAKIVALTILISVFSGANSIALSAPRVFYAMATDGLFFRRLGNVHPRFRTPAVAVIALGVWAAFLTCLGNFQQLITYAMFVAWIFYGMAAASIFAYRRKYPGLKRPYRVPGYPWTPLVFVLAAAVLVINSILSAGRDSLLGLGLVALGLPAYLVWRGKRWASVEHHEPANSQRPV
jgi:basic amino acid/polyamine antiporter, APA family